MLRGRYGVGWMAWAWGVIIVTLAFIAWAVIVTVALHGT